MLKTQKKIYDGKLTMGDGVCVEYKYIDNGAPSTIAFVNGIGTYGGWIGQMRIRGYNLLFHNSRGMGQSGWNGGHYLNSTAEDLGVLCRNFSSESVHLIGHSMGGLIAANFFTNYRQDIPIETMTLVSSPLGNPIDTFPYRKWLFFNVERLLTFAERFSHIIPFGSEKIPTALYLVARSQGQEVDEKTFVKYTEMLKHPKEAITALRCMIEHGDQIGARMAGISVRTLVIHAERDFLVEQSAAHKIAGCIPNSRLHIFPKASHAPMLEEPFLFNSVLLEFLGN